MTTFELLQIVTGGIGSLCFAILFNIQGKKLFFASLGGFLSWALFVLLKFLTPSEPIRYFLVAVLISVYAEITARILKTPTTTFHMTALIPLIPGGSLYYTMSSIFDGNLGQFVEKGIYTLKLAVALAFGIVIVTAATHTISKISSKRL